MTNPQRINERIRFQTTVDTPLGQTMAYLRLKDYDLKREAEKLLVSRFLPFALTLGESGATSVHLQASTHVAYDCISQFAGIIQMIREVYQLQPVHPSTFPSPDSLSIAYQLSEAIQMMRQPDSHPGQPTHSPLLSPNVLTSNGYSLSAQAAPEPSEDEGGDLLEADVERQQTDEQYKSLFGE
jgi:hypothetical protein